MNTTELACNTFTALLDRSDLKRVPMRTRFYGRIVVCPICERDANWSPDFWGWNRGAWYCRRCNAVIEEELK